MALHDEPPVELQRARHQRAHHHGLAQHAGHEIGVAGLAIRTAQGGVQRRAHMHGTPANGLSVEGEHGDMVVENAVERDVECGCV